MARPTSARKHPPGRKAASTSTIGICNCSALRKASRRVSQYYDDALVPYGIKITQRSILEHISQAGAPSTSELADAMAMERSAMSRNLQPMEREGWVEFLINPDDRRGRYVNLTAAGRDILAATFDAWKKAQAAFECTIGKAAAAELRATLSQVASSDFIETCRAQSAINREVSG